MFKAIGFIFQEGSSFLFTLLILGFAFGVNISFLQLPQDDVGMFVITIVSLGYLSLQMAMASFAKVGEDRPLVDLFFSFFPMIALIVIVVLAGVGVVKLQIFHMLGLMVAGCVTLMDIIFNTQVLFKMNRLATDMVQMR